MERILISGATGFLGGTLVSQLLTRREWPHVLLLIRSQTPEEGVKRMLTVLGRFNVPDHLLARISAKQIICGDITNTPLFAADERLQEVSHVLNCAAVTSFGASPNIWNTNVHGTLAFANCVKGLPRLKRFIHTSTAMVCGMAPPAVVQEEAYPRAEVEHFVEYTRSKSQAEILLRDTLEDCPMVVVRPTIVVGHTTLGCKPSGSIFWAFRMFDALGRITGELDGSIDVIPADYCAAAMIHLLFKDKLQYPVYHISSGTQHSSSFNQLGHAFARSMKKRYKPYPTVDFRGFQELQGDFHRIFGPCNRRLMLKAIKLYGTFASLNTTFNNHRLRSEGMLPPPRLADYLDVCMESCRDISIPEQMLIDFQ